MTSTYLQPTPYEDGDALHNGDQVLVPAEIWTQFDVVGASLFVTVSDCVYGRLRPATPDDGLPADSCRLPAWMLKQLDATNEWVSLNSVARLDTVAHMVLRARREADVLAMSDPVAVLSTDLSASWAVLTVGQELTLPCGVFDVMELEGAGGVPMAAGSILDTDVSLEFVPALDSAVAERIPTPVPVVTPPFSEEEEEAMPFGIPVPKTGYVPFSGKGHVLGSR